MWRTRHVGWLSTCVVALGALGCSSEEGGSAGGPPAHPEPATAVVAYGAAAETELTLYPSDRYTVADSSTRTGLRVDLSPSTTADQLVSLYGLHAAQVSSLDGFSPSGGLVIRFNEPIDPRGLQQFPDADPPITDPVLDASAYTQPGAPLYLADIDPDSPEFGTLIGLVPTWWEQAADDFYLLDEFTLIAHPAAPLRPATRYAFVATDVLRAAADGTPVGRTQESHDLLTGRSVGAYDDDVRAALDVLEPLAGLERDSVVAASVFTTADVQRGMIDLGIARRAAPAPALGDPWTIETAVQADGRVRLRATYASPEYRAASDHKWRLGADGAPEPQASMNLEVFLAFSDATQGGPRPVVLYGHGLGGDKDGNWGTAGRLDPIHQNGVAVFSIDSPEHGSRTTGETTLISSVYGFFGIEQGTNDFDIERARDNFRQMAADQLELVRFIGSLGTLDVLPLDASGQPAGDGEPDLDLSQILYIGHSFGSVQGPTIMALAPEITQATWNVGGASLMMLLRDSNTFNLVVKGLAPAGTAYGSVARFMAITQAIVDPGDPINFARYCTLEGLEGVPGWRGRDVLLQEVAADTIVPNSTSEILARAAGLQLLGRASGASGVVEISGATTSNLPSGSTAVLSQFATVSDESTGAPRRADHGGLIFKVEAIDQYNAFFTSGLAAEHATVPERAEP